MARLLRVKSTVLSIAIAHTHTEQIKSPIMTVLTIQWACQNSVNSERSEEVSGSTDCATSAGFMGTSFALSALSVRPAAETKSPSNGQTRAHTPALAP